LLADGVRVLSRTLKQAQQALPTTNLSKETFRDRTRSAKRAARKIARQAQRGKAAVKKTYHHLVNTTQASVHQAQQVLEELKQVGDHTAERLCQTLETFIPRVEQVISQTTRRIFQEEQVPAAEKLVSIFEPHSAIIKRGKVNRDTEFGHKIWLDEVEGGIISGYRMLDGNAADSEQWQPSLDHHCQQFARPPDLASADRGVYSEPNETYATQLSVKRVILPKPGTKSQARRDYERQRWFKRGRRWHAGVEGRISVVKRKHGLGRCLAHGQDGFARWVGWGVIANNLTMIGRSLAHA
jgi:IS5 family transposase